MKAMRTSPKIIDLMYPKMFRSARKSGVYHCEFFFAYPTLIKEGLSASETVFLDIIYRTMDKGIGGSVISNERLMDILGKKRAWIYTTLRKLKKLGFLFTVSLDKIRVICLRDDNFLNDLASWIYYPRIRRKHDLSLIETVVFQAVKRLQGEDGHCYATNKFFKIELGVSKTSMGRILKKLQKLNLVWVTIYKRAKCGGSYRQIVTKTSCAKYRAFLVGRKLFHTLRKFFSEFFPRKKVKNLEEIMPKAINSKRIEGRVVSASRDKSTIPVESNEAKNLKFFDMLCSELCDKKGFTSTFEEDRCTICDSAIAAPLEDTWGSVSPTHTRERELSLPLSKNFLSFQLLFVKFAKAHLWL